MVAALMTTELLLGGLALLLMTVHGIGYGLQCRRRAEFERHLLELLQLSTSHGQAIEPVLRRAALEAPNRERRYLELITKELENGQPLAEALQTGARNTFAPHVLASIAAADGTASLSAVLGDLAHRRDRGAALRYRVALAASYPALLGALLLLLSSCWAFVWSVETPSSTSAPHPIEPTVLGNWLLVIAIATCGIWLILAIGWRPSAWTNALASLTHRLPWLGPRLRLLPASRALRTCAAMTASGAAMATALRQSAPAAADWRYGTSFEAAAEMAEGGAPPEQFWERTGLPAFVIARLLTGRDSREQLSKRLTEVAEQCQQHSTRAVERALGILQPTVLAGFGLVVAVQFADLMTWIDAWRAASTEQMPW